MAVFLSFLKCVLLAVCYASVATARPPSRLAHIKTRSPTLPKFSHKSTFQTFGDGLASSSIIANAQVKAISLDEKSKAFVSSHISAQTQNIAYHSGYSGDVVEHAYLKQQHEGIPFANAVANVAYKDGKVVAFGHSFVNATTIASSTPEISVDSAISKAEAALGGTHTDVTPTLEYYVKDDDSVALAHVVHVRNDKAGTWYEGFIDAHSGELLAAVDFVADARYRVIPITSQSPKDGFQEAVNPPDKVSSPYGWHSYDGKEFSNDTSGNNVIVYLDADPSSTASQSSPGLVFDFKQNPGAEPSVPVNVNASLTNVFYILNTVHDVAYKYGFTESAFNFQQRNLAGTGGLGGDRIQASVQNSMGTDNAGFATLPDGMPGFMRMYLWDYTVPGRDGGLENDIVSHEATHGITNRMTGGGTARCLQSEEARGLGEGWSDAMAEWLEQKTPIVKDFIMASYVLNNTSGYRKYPYSTNKNVNPLTYHSLLTVDETHGAGEIWANMLHNVYAALVQAYGFSSTAHTDPTGSQGNVVWLHLFLDALPLQPCEPEFITARDAWIQADKNRYKGKHTCFLWKAFASRGLGAKANNTDYADDFSVPKECQ